MIRKNFFTTVFCLCLMAVCWMPMAAQDSTLRGDVDNDSKVAISDVTALINYLLSNDDSLINRGAADVDADGAITITDVTTLINYLLTGEWPEIEVYEPQYETVTVGTVTFRMVFVEGGTFMMGGREGDPYVKPWEYPVHEVTLSDYYIGEMEVTQALWRAVMGTSNNPSWFCSTNGYANDYQRPVECMTYSQVTSFITKINQKTGLTFRLPTEAEWEYAARGGKWSKGYLYVGGDNVDEVAWHKGNGNETTHPVGLTVPNELAIYDMAGNVEEWTGDWYGLYTDAPQVNPTGATSNAHNERVLRGGSWDQAFRMCRPTQRHEGNIAFKSAHTGLRLVLVK